MTAVQFRNTDIRLSQALEKARCALTGHDVSLRELLGSVGEQGLLVFCAILAMPFMLPVSVPFMSTAFGTPMLLIGFAVMVNRVPWLPNRVLQHRIDGETVQHVLVRAAGTAAKFEHLVRPRMHALTASQAINRCNGLTLIVAVLILMAPLPLVPFANTLPAIGILFLCLGIAERDGMLVLLGYGVTLVSGLYVGTLLWLVVEAGSDPQAAYDAALDLFQRLIQ
jgi:Uncharacterized ABC-type transport system, permease components